MATKISGMTAITAGAYDDTALSERVNNAGVTRKATVAQDRVALLIANAITAGMIAAGTIVNADINAAAAIVDTKLATISTAGKVSNSATTATSANTASAIVARDASGNFSAGTITAVTGLTVTAGGATITAGNLAVSAGSVSATTTGSQGTITDGNGNGMTWNTTNALGSYWTFAVSGAPYAYVGSERQVFGSGSATAMALTTSGATGLYLGTNGTRNLTLASGGAATLSSSLTVTGAFGCNTKAAQTAFASGGALAGYVTGVFGLDSGANMSALHALVVAIRAALVANGIMS